MQFRLVMLFTAVGTFVWVMAIVGVISVVQAFNPDASKPARSDALLPVADISGADVAELPRYNGSTRSEFRRMPFGDLNVTEVEYISDATVGEIRRHYRDAFDREGWTVQTTGLERGEWTYTIDKGDRAVTVEIERVGGVTEVEIELSEPLQERDSLSDR
jgi:hypothetical protein